MRIGGVLLLLLVGGCGTATTPGVDGSTDAASLVDAGHDAASVVDVGADADRDTSCYPPEFTPRFHCSGGTVYETQCSTGPCVTCTTFERTDVSCPNGCRMNPLQFPQQPEDVCAIVAEVGTPCAVDGDCMPAAADDGYGGPPIPGVLHCDVGHRACARDDELCDTVDDDLDGTVDEGCACIGRTLLFTGVPAIPGEAAMGGDRILVSAWSDLGTRLALTDPSGLALATFPVPSAASLARIDGGFLYGQGTGARPAALRRIGDDGMRFGTDVLVPWGGPLTHVGLWGSDVVAIAPTGTVPLWSLARVTPEGVVAATGTFAASEDVRLASLDDGTPLVVDGATSEPIRLLVAATDATTHEVATASSDRVGPASEVVHAGGRLWITAHDASGAVVIAAIDPATGDWAETLSLGTITTSPGIGGVVDPVVHLAARGEHLFALWRDLHGAVRTVVLDTTGARLGESTLPLEGPSSLVPGGTDAGMRVVAGVRLLAPCDAL